MTRGIYRATGDDEKKVGDYFKAKEIAENINDHNLLSMVYMNLGISYFLQNKLDSALVYERTALANTEIGSFKLYSGKIFSSIGEIYSKKGDYDSAKMYLSESIERAGNRKIFPIWLRPVFVWLIYCGIMVIWIPAFIMQRPA